MAKQQTSRQQQMDERDQRAQDGERNKDFGDRAVEARLPDDPRAMAPRDAIGRPSTGEPV